MATQERKFGFSTRQLHSGYDPEATTGSRAAPIYMTTAYDLQSTDRAARLFALQEAGNIYTRIGNPTSNIVEQRLADLRRLLGEPLLGHVPAVDRDGRGLVAVHHRIDRAVQTASRRIFPLRFSRQLARGAARGEPLAIGARVKPADTGHRQVRLGDR